MVGQKLRQNRVIKKALTGCLLPLIPLFLLAMSNSCTAADSPRESAPQNAVAQSNERGFQPLRLGGGGFVVDLDFSPDGRTRIVRTDVHGAYIWNGDASEWKQLVTAGSLPPGDPLIRGGTGIGVYAIRVAPSDSWRLYMVAPALTGIPSYVYRSDDRGAHWIRTKFSPVEMSVQSDGRQFGPKMAIDPVNPDIVLLGDSAGHLHRTQDGGESWSMVGEGQVPVGAEPAIAFGVSPGSRASSNEVFVATGSNGVYQSIDGGQRWTKTNGGPRSVDRLVAAPGSLYATDRDNISLNNAWKLTGNQWARLEISSPSKGNGWHSIAVDLSKPSQIVLGSGSGNIASSSDGGISWSKYYGDAPERHALDVPWLAWTLESWMTNGNMMFDPVVADKLYFAEGIGVWYTQPQDGNSKPTWVSQTRGIEELIVNDVTVPPGGKPIFAVQDRGVFRIENPELFPSTHGPYRDVPIRHVWSIDYASAEPSYVAIIANGGAGDRSSYSTDGGRTWSPFISNAPVGVPGNLGGTIAVSSANNILWGPSNNGRPFFTTDGGRNWKLAQFPAELPTGGELGWSFSLYQNRHVFAADRVLPGTFYAYNYGPPTAVSAAGTYRSSDGGATWVKVSNGFGIAGSMGTSARLATVPGQAGHLFFAVGTTGLYNHPYNVPLKRSRDGGRSWQDLGKTQEVWAIGFGKAAPSKNYPTIYIAGFANGDRDPALYRSIDEGVSWQKLASYPAGNIDSIRAISGDMNVFGRIYYGFSGSGAGYGNFPA